jgi:alkylated DNA nucleotide flippase Atl1
MPKKSWRDKFENPGKGLPKVVSGPSEWVKRFGGRKVLIATPLLVDEVLQKIPKGRLITIKQIREKLAKDFKAEACCPLTTGIFLRIVSEVSEEDKKSGKKRITPYRRVVRENGSLIDKFPGELKAQAKYLKEEGHKILSDKKVPRIKEFEKYLYEL